jgi:hypothetical protein
MSQAKRALAGMSGLLLTGCIGTGGALTVKVPVPIACQQLEPERPRMPTDRLKISDSQFDKVKAMQAEIEIREGYEGRLRAALRACTKPIEPPVAF